MPKGKPKRKLQSKKCEREARTRKCMTFILRAGSIPAAMKLAAASPGEFAAQTSAWLTALGRILEDDDLAAQLCSIVEK